MTVPTDNSTELQNIASPEVEKEFVPTEDIPETDETSITPPTHITSSVEEKEYLTSSPLPKDWDEKAPTITLPSARWSELNKAINAAAQLDSELLSEEWKNTLINGRLTEGTDGFFDGVSESNPNYKAGVSRGDSIYRVTTQQPRHIEGKQLSGETGVNYFMSKMQKGRVWVPFYHGGFWVQINQPSGDHLIAIHEALISKRIKLGADTQGLIFSNSLYYTTEVLVGAFIDLIYTTNIKDKLSVADRIGTAPIQDIESIITGLLFATRPNGIQTVRACSSDIDKCRYIARDILDPKTLLKVDNSRFNDFQKALLSKVSKESITPEDIDNYRLQMIALQDSAITIKKNDQYYKLHIKNPTINDYITAGRNWVSGIETFVDSAFRSNTFDTPVSGKSEEEKLFYYNSREFINRKNSLIIEFSKTSFLAEYGHFINKISEYEDGTEPNSIEGDAEIKAILKQMSDDQTISDQIMSGVKSYIDKNTLAIPAITSFVCPNCNTVQVENNLISKQLLPLELIQTFFILLFQYRKNLKETRQ